jgi:hypothetical protein
VLIFFSGWIAFRQFAPIRTFDDIGIAKLSALGGSHAPVGGKPFPINCFRESIHHIVECFLHNSFSLIDISF